MRKGSHRRIRQTPKRRAIAGRQSGLSGGALLMLARRRRLDHRSAATHLEATERTDHRPRASPMAPFTIASSVKAKARDILAAVRIVKHIDREVRAASPEERETLTRFAGFGPVALTIFPDPVSGKYKNATWQALGETLQSL